MVQDGQTAVIGGLIRTNEGYYETGVPVLRNIPLVGGLFGSKSRVDEQRELLIFVTPRIVN
jgi:type II secretory pathway component GspD/PulD (secretin)